MRRKKVVLLLAPIALGCAVFAVGCAAPSAETPVRAKVAGFDARAGVRASMAVPAWRDTIASPTPGASDAELSFCGDADAALTDVATQLARRAARGEPEVDAPEIDFDLRRAGSPLVWPHVWTLSGASPGDAPDRLRAFLQTLPPQGNRRCGVARALARDHTETVAAVVTDAVADLDPTPVRVHAGQWIRITARLLVPATSAKLVVLGPFGPPRILPTTLHGDRIESTFAVDREGAWSAQVLATLSSGPRPVLEATLFADAEPPRSFGGSSAPGEDAGRGETDDANRLFAMLEDARRLDGLASMTRNTALDALAVSHARAMHARRLLAHDAGDGSPTERLRGVSVSRFGENVAHAADVRGAHRILWASPSHRGNLLDPSFDAVGVGVDRDEDGSVWVCEVFGDFAGDRTRRFQTTRGTE